MSRWDLLDSIDGAHAWPRVARARAGLETEGNPGFRVFLRTPAIELGLFRSLAVFM